MKLNFREARGHSCKGGAAASVIQEVDIQVEAAEVEGEWGVRPFMTQLCSHLTS